MSSNENTIAAAYGTVWLDANRYYEAERRYLESQSAWPDFTSQEPDPHDHPRLNESLEEIRSRTAQAYRKANPGSPKSSVPNGMSQSSLASEIAYARQKIQNFLKSGVDGVDVSQSSGLSRIEKLEKEHATMSRQIEQLTSELNRVLAKLSAFEKAVPLKNLQVNETQGSPKENKKSDIQNGAATNDDDDLDLFGSDEEDADAAKLREERLQAYANKKAKKPALVAKSSVVLDVKPWDDETDMEAMEKEVRKIQTEGLVWGASKLVPLAYGIKKLQIVAIVEDEKVSIDWLQETISEIEDLVQSVDIAAFNKL